MSKKTTMQSAAATPAKKHVLQILGPEGHIEHEWGAPDSPEAGKAKEEFDKRIPTYQAAADNKPTRVFDAHAEKTVMFPRMQAGA